MPKILNVTLEEKNTEYPIVIGTAAQWSLQSRGGDEIRFAFEPGIVAKGSGPYATLKPGQVYRSNVPCLSQEPLLTLYVATSTAGAVVEVIKS